MPNNISSIQPLSASWPVAPVRYSQTMLNNNNNCPVVDDQQQQTHMIMLMMQQQKQLYLQQRQGRQRINPNERHYNSNTTNLAYQIVTS